MCLCVSKKRHTGNYCKDISVLSIGKCVLDPSVFPYFLLKNQDFRPIIFCMLLVDALLTLDNFAYTRH